jgi:hypothetical protein
LEGLGVDRGKYKINLKETGYKGVDWIEMAWGRDQWRSHLNTMIKV